MSKAAKTKASSMGENTSPQPLTYHKIIAEVSARLTDPVHKRIVNAWSPKEPVEAMETELGKILLELIADED